MLTLLFALSALADPWDDVAEKAGMPVAEVRALVEPVATRQQSVLDRMATPWEAKPWHAYFPLFLTDERLEKGLAFWQAHEAVLARVSEQTGVPAEYVVAIIGVETKYGERMGNDRVIDALYTLGFFHETRGRFFRRELGHFVRLATDEGWALGDPMGSYAGAMGYGQFIPSSYRHYAVDGDADGHRDLFANPDDAVASVAHYLAEHGWMRGEPVLLEATVTTPEGLLGKELELTATWAELRGRGVGVVSPPPDTAKARVYDFDLEGGVEYRVGLTNFYVITRYNHSKLYARVVHELAMRLRASRPEP